MGGPCVGLSLEWIMIDSEIFVKNLNDSPPLYCTPEMHINASFANYFFVILFCVLEMFIVS